MTSIEMSIVYVETYQKWKDVDKIVVVGFGFGADDEHINGIIRTLIDKDAKAVEVVTLKSNKSNDEIVKEIARKLKISKYDKISVIQVDSQGKGPDGRMWTEII